MDISKLVGASIVRRDRKIEALEKRLVELEQENALLRQEVEVLRARLNGESVETLVH